MARRGAVSGGGRGGDERTLSETASRSCSNRARASALPGGDSGASASRGGGILSFGELVNLTFCTVAGNSGGGINVQAGVFEFVSSAVTGNQAGAGGGLKIRPGATLNSTNSTFSGNESTASLGGSAFLNAGTLNLVSATIAENVEASGDDLLNLATGVIHLTDSILDGTCEDLGALYTNGGNLESPGDTCGLNSASDIVDVPDTRLWPLRNWGGATEVHMPAVDSPAVDAIGDCIGWDQRGQDRPIDGNNNGTVICDVGAVERDIIFTDGFESGSTGVW